MKGEMGAEACAAVVTLRGQVSPDHEQRNQMATENGDNGVHGFAFTDNHLGNKTQMCFLNICNNSVGKYPEVEYSVGKYLGAGETTQ